MRGYPVFDDGGRLVGLAEFTQEVTARKRTEKQLLQLNQELEQRVRRRTAELSAANSELDAFAYSVSHDLRAPLRSLRGFAEALSEDFGPRLDDVGRDYLGRILSSAERMTGLIDGLLALSRATLADLERQEVNLTELAEEIVAELRAEDPGRRVEVRIAAGLCCTGDRALLRQVLHNLLANAWKFTRDEPDPHFDFGRLTPDEAAAIGRGREEVFFVRDNGAGFDMDYAKRLFEPFQRLHGADEYPGTGIGLATVRRIIRRHAGEVWAEGTPGQGATFYLTLP
jgi:signal transduction histidine kinase